MRLKLVTLDEFMDNFKYNCGPQICYNYYIRCLTNQEIEGKFMFKECNNYVFK